jgi:hypothetical protein
MTPRERAEVTYQAWLDAFETDGTNVSLSAIIEAAIIADRRELLAPDEATVEAMARARFNLARENGGPRCKWEEVDDETQAEWIAEDRVALAALRRLKGVE